MLKILAAGLCALFITMSSPGHAETTPLAEKRAAFAERVKQLLSVDWDAVTEARIAVIKAALQLKPDQEKYWPPIEQAIRDRAGGRHQRLEKLAARLDKQGESVDPIALMRDRAETLSERAAGLTKLADAWQPLYQTLDDKQRQRLHTVAMHVLREVKEAVERRRMDRDDDDDED